MATKKVSKKAPAKKVSTKAVKKDVNKAKKEIAEAVDAVEDAVETAAETVFARVAKNVDAAQGVARQAWLAYLGAIGRTYDEVVTRANKLNEDRLELVEDLVARGEQVQDDAEARLKESRANVEEQIEVAKDRLTKLTTRVDLSARLKGLSDRLESLSKDLKKSA